MYFRRKTSAGRAYLQIVESRRDGDQVRQQVIATLGRFDELQASGQLERLVRSGARFAAKAMVLSAASNDAAIKIAVRRIGPALVFERLWEETGCRAVIADLAGKRGHKFALERAVFLTVLHRLFVSGSDRAADRWREDYAIAGVDGLDLHHLYRAMAWLGEELPEKEQDGRTPFSPRCNKDVVEERLFAHRRDLLTRLDLVFMDTTSLYFEGAGGETLGQLGSQQGLSSAPQAGGARHGARRRRSAVRLLPVARQHRRRDAADAGGPAPARALRHRPRLRRRRPRHDQRRHHCGAGEARGSSTFWACASAPPRRSATEVIEDDGVAVPLTIPRQKGETQLAIKETTLKGRRYVLCRNEEEARKDAERRAAILAGLERKLAQGDKALVSNKGFRRFVKTIASGNFSIDYDKVEADAKFDGLFVLRTNTRLSAAPGRAALSQLAGRGGRLQDRQGTAHHAADLPQDRRRHSRSRVLQLPRRGAEEGAVRPHRRALRLLVGDHR